MSSPDPLAGIHAAVNRVLHDDPSAEPFLPEQRITLVAALTAYTAGSAYANHLDDTGTLAVGKRADLAVLDHDPFAVPPEEIGESRVVATYVDGKEVFTA